MILHLLIFNHQNFVVYAPVNTLSLNWDLMSKQLIKSNVHSQDITHSIQLYDYLLKLSHFMEWVLLTFLIK